MCSHLCNIFQLFLNIDSRKLPNSEYNFLTLPHLYITSVDVGCSKLQTEYNFEIDF